MSRPTAARVASLDLLRGVAVLLVLAAHWGGFGEAVAVSLGNAGVILFFFLSGMLIEQNLARGIGLGDFAIRRAYRILPAYWLSLIAAAAIYGASPIQAISNATFTAPAFGIHRMQGVYWTLYVEVAFYCVAPVIARQRSAVIIAGLGAVIATAALLVATRGIGSGAFYYLTFCLCGSLIGRWLRGATPAREAILSTVAATIGAVALMPTSWLVGIPAALCAVALVVAVRCDLQNRALAFFGQISFSLYLSHTLIFDLASILTGDFWAALAVAIPGSVAVSYLSWTLVERPAINLGRQIKPTRGGVSIAP